jgi:RsiW-degrading membrane proteinase PrsW (M82 family)
LCSRSVPEGYLTTPEVVFGFLAAGTVAVLTTAVAEVYLLPEAAGTFIGVGVIEETGKGLVLLAVAHTVHHREPRDGMLLGAVVGAGFASFESAGYALHTMLQHLDEHTIADILETEAFRGVLAPFGHITWTALLGGALFAVRPRPADRRGGALRSRHLLERNRHCGASIPPGCAAR